DHWIGRPAGPRRSGPSLCHPFQRSNHAQPAVVISPSVTEGHGAEESLPCRIAKGKRFLDFAAALEMTAFLVLEDRTSMCTSRSPTEGRAYRWAALLAFGNR